MEKLERLMFKLWFVNPERVDHKPSTGAFRFPTLRHNTSVFLNEDSAYNDALLTAGITDAAVRDGYKITLVSTSGTSTATCEDEASGESVEVNGASAAEAVAAAYYAMTVGKTPTEKHIAELLPAVVIEQQWRAAKLGEVAQEVLAVARATPHQR